MSVPRLGLGMMDAQLQKLVRAVLQDVQIDVSRVAVNVDVTASRQGNKKRKWQAVEGAEGAPKEDDPHGVRDAALDVLEHILSLSGSIPAILRNGVNHVIISSLLTAGCDVTISGKREADPISTVDRQHLHQLRLLRCLLSAIVHTDEGQESILVFGVRLFQGYLRSSDVKIRAFCMEALTTCNLIIHPKLPPIQRLQINKQSSVGNGNGQFVEIEMDLDGVGNEMELKRPRLDNGFGGRTSVQPPVTAVVPISVPLQPMAPVMPALAPASAPLPVFSPATVAAPTTSFTPAVAPIPPPSATPGIVPLETDPEPTLPQSSLPTNLPTNPFAPSTQAPAQPTAAQPVKTAAQSAPQPSAFTEESDDDEDMPQINIDDDDEDEESD
ncbi:hypothetical protein HDV00_010277 [Rhizophlyctis rosea]|nr:hypothetical protein HDV00_010277 [Rhizophlyctis rosea]